MINVIIPTHTLYNQSKTRGIGVYTRELIRALLLPRINHNRLQVTTTSTNPYSVKADIVHYPFFDLFFHTLPLLKRIPTIVTIHDVIPLKYPAHFPVGIRGRINYFLQKVSLINTKLIITDSISSKNDIITYLKINPNKIKVVSLAPVSSRRSLRLSSRIKKIYNLPESYLLYVGDINWNKNIPALLNVLPLLANQNLHLVCVGKVFADKPNIPEYRVITQRISELGISERVHMMGYVPSHHLPVIYHLARLYVQPSWDEGFGLTILEAMTFGCPVISSNKGSLKEVGGDAAYYFDPSIPDDLVHAINKLDQDLLLRKELTTLGSDHIKSFNWDKTATQTLEIYQKVAEKS